MAVAMTNSEQEKYYVKAKSSDYDTVRADWSRKAAPVKKIKSDSRNSELEGLQDWLRVRRKAVGTLARSFKEEQELTASLAQDPVDADLGEYLFQNKLNSG